MKYFKSIILIFLSIFLFSCSIEKSLNDIKNYFDDTYVEDININTDLKVHFIDVGQGDAIFIELPNNEAMLIDAGESKTKEKVYDYIKDLGYNEITYVVGTHPHTDHIGALAYIIENMDVKNIYLSKVASNTKTYENLLLTIKNKGKSITAAQKGKYILNSEELKIYFLGPIKDDYKELNNHSAIVKIIFKDKSFLFMGDAEALVEKSLTDVKADVIKIGHHGSDTSSSDDFISKVGAKYGIIMVGENNQYDHPSIDVIKKWERAGTTIYRTDLNGNIVVSSDGTNLEVDLEKGEK